MPQIQPYNVASILFEKQDPFWSELFFHLKDLLDQSRLSYSFEHIGSTAIPSMPGKNVGNFLIITSPDLFPIWLTYLDDIGFHDHPFKIEPPHRPLKVGEWIEGEKPYKIHLHLTPQQSPDHRNALFFRDYLRSHPAAQIEYAQLKQQAAENYSLASQAYNQAKGPFIQAILAKNEAPSST